MTPSTRTLTCLCVAAYLVAVRLLRNRRLNALRKKWLAAPRPVPVDTVHEATAVFGRYDVPYLAQKSLEFALFRTYCIPSISRLLAATGQMSGHCLRRTEDTSLLISHYLYFAPWSDSGSKALCRMNTLHGHYQISNDDYLYVLSCFVCEPPKWIDQYEWRGLEDFEVEAWTCLWQHIAGEMGINEVPATYEGFCTLQRNYEAENMRYHPANHTVAMATRQVFLDVYPSFLHPLLGVAIDSLCDPPLRRALGFSDPSPLVEWLVGACLRGRAAVVGWLLPPRLLPKLRVRDQPGADGRHHVAWHEYGPVYPQGYTIESLGPDRWAREAGS